MKKQYLLPSICLLVLAACDGRSTRTNTASVHVTHSSVSETVSSEKASDEGTSDASGSLGGATNEKEEKPLDLSKIKLGDYSQLIGEWTEVGHLVNYRKGAGIEYVDGGEDTLDISETVIKNSQQLSLSKDVLTYRADTFGLQFTEDSDSLIVSLVDASSASINWTIFFYPIGTNKEYALDRHTGLNKENLIIIASSTHSYTQIFSQNTVEAQEKTY